MEGFIVPAPVLETDAVAAFQSFETAFNRRFGRDPDATATAAYDAATLLIHLLQQSRGHAVRESFPIGFSFAGASGILAFDSQGNRKAKLELLKALDGRFVPAKTQQPTEAMNR